MADNINRDRDLNKNNPDNRDPLSGAPGAHPVGVGVGAAGAGAAGAAIGAALGPVGSVAGAAIGAVVGAVAGGLAGKGAAEAINPTAEEAYWRDNYKHRPYYTPGATYEEYGPAYRYGWESRQQHSGKKFDEVESHLRTGWDKTRSKTAYEWDKAKHAVRDAWDRVEQHGTRRDVDRNVASDADRDLNPDSPSANLSDRSRTLNP